MSVLKIMDGMIWLIQKKRKMFVNGEVMGNIVQLSTATTVVLHLT